VDKSTVSRELKRNNAQVNAVKYRGHRAQKRADARKKESHRRQRLADPQIRAYVEQRLKEDGWTPEEIAGRFAEDFPALKTNYETIYAWIYHDRRDLIQYLPKSHRKRHKRRFARQSRVGKIPNRTPIAERPASIETREEVGHWEADTAETKFLMFPAKANMR
jgi:IS30 family transposase